MIEKLKKYIKSRGFQKACTVMVILFLIYDFGHIFWESAFPVKKPENNIRQTYMIYYGELDDSIIKDARRYDIVILHPDSGNITRQQVEAIQKGGTIVFGYLSVGEDLRTNGMTPEQMLTEIRFTGDKTGPRVAPENAGLADLEGNDISGRTSPGGSGFASYYLDDNDYDGMPDFNPSFNCAYTNIGDPAWYDELNQMQKDGTDQVAGIREILTEDYGRGLGCDGLFLDTIDTCAPDLFTRDDDPCRTRFEWTAPGVARFMQRLKEEYPDKYILQNRGLFFYNYYYPHYEYSPRKYIDFLLFESYMLDSDPARTYKEDFFADNKNVYAPKISAEANRPDGFKVLSLGYAEGPEELGLKSALSGNTAAAGFDVLMEDIVQAQDKAGFSHYITDGSLTLVNDFVLEHSEADDILPPVWSSVHNNSEEYPKQESVPRTGIGEVELTEDGIIVRWDVAVDKSGVIYTLYYQSTPFDFEKDPDLERAQQIELCPETGKGYGYGAAFETYPYQSIIKGLDKGVTYYFVIRAKDCSPGNNEEKNTVVKKGSLL